MPARGGAGSGADDRAAAPLVLVEPVAEHAAGKGTDTGADGGLDGGLGAVRMRRAGGEQQNTSTEHLDAFATFPRRTSIARVRSMAASLSRTGRRCAATGVIAKDRYWLANDSA